MRKQELIHLHGLLIGVREYLDEQDVLDPESFESYESVDVDPTSIHRSKADHEAAVCRLADDFRTTVPEDARSPESTSSRN